MIHPDDRDDAIRDLLRQTRPSAVDAVRAARVRVAVHAAWRDTTKRTWSWRRAVPMAAAALLVVAAALTLATRLRDRGTAPAAAPIASTLFAAGEVVIQHDGQVRAGRVGETLSAGSRI